jgi:tRNA(fMet)-specific endonuclease VapC
MAASSRNRRNGRSSTRCFRDFPSSRHECRHRIARPQIGCADQTRSRQCRRKHRPPIVVHELYFGAHKSAKIQHNLETFRLLFADFPILDFDLRDAYFAGEIRAALATHGTPIGPYDVLIAGQAKARELVIITNNIREFARVEALRAEDWTA